MPNPNQQLKPENIFTQSAENLRAMIFGLIEKRALRQGSSKWLDSLLKKADRAETFTLLGQIRDALLGIKRKK